MDPGEQEGQLCQIINSISGDDNIYGRFVSMEVDLLRPTHQIVWFTAKKTMFSISIHNNERNFGFRYLVEELSINWNS
jgi:hypothetical protein